MNENRKDELQTRRQFFKRVAKGALPIVALSVAPSLLFTSCGDEPACSDCTSHCASSCTVSCYNTSTNSSDSSCSNCSTTCTSTCGQQCSANCSNNSTNSSSGSSQKIPSDADGKIDNYEYVDLGLSVKWARYNIGATKPEANGSYLSPNSVTGGYFYDELIGQGLWGDNQTTSGTSLDLASYKWGKKWRMPTRREYEELINNCDVSCIELNNKKGFLFTSKRNGKSIFLIAAGEQYNGKLGNEGNWGCYWTGDLKISGYSNFEFYALEFWGVISTGVANNKIEKSDTYDFRKSVRAVTTGTGSGSGSGNTSGCNGNCSSVCADSASGGCSGCQNDCNSGCRKTCDYICSNTCSGKCYGNCSTSCGGTCKYVSAGNSCSGCSSTCYNQCYNACDHACYGACMSQCISSSK